MTKAESTIFHTTIFPFSVAVWLRGPLPAVHVHQVAVRLAERGSHPGHNYAARGRRANAERAAGQVGQAGGRHGGLANGNNDLQGTDRPVETLLGLALLGMTFRTNFGLKHLWDLLIKPEETRVGESNLQLICRNVLNRVMRKVPQALRSLKVTPAYSDALYIYVCSACEQRRLPLSCASLWVVGSIAVQAKCVSQLGTVHER